MFEKYTETARKTVLSARYEATQFGSHRIETQHLLLGLLRADPLLATRVFKSQKKLEELRERIAQEAPRAAGKISISVDLPLSSECQRVLSYAAEEAARLQQHHIGPEHLLLAMARGETSVAARVILESGITISQLEQEVKEVKGAAAATAPPLAHEGLRDLVAEARNAPFGPLIGRERELEQIIQILSRRTRNSAVLVGEPGVGKNAIVQGLARRIAGDEAPAALFDRKILMVDGWALARMFTLLQSGDVRVTASPQPKLLEVIQNGDPILYVRGLFDLRESMPLLARFLTGAKLQLIATGAPLSFRLALDRNDELARSFEAVTVQPPTEPEAIQILTSVKEQFENFHGVVLSPDAIEMAVSASGRFLRHRSLPDRAIDLIDEAGALVKLRREAEARKFSHHGPDKPNRPRAELEPAAADNVVTAEHIFEAIAARTSISVARVKAALQPPEVSNQRDQIQSELAAQIPAGRRDWVEGLTAYLADCSPEEA
ncbi:MAG: Clp protease N-terminal domain-containing protein, partial [Bryobacteraceae bacterium]